MNILQEIWNDLDEAYEYMERAIEKMSYMSLSKELYEIKEKFDLSEISYMKQLVEEMMENKKEIEEMKKYYVFENGWDVATYENKEEAIRVYEISLDRLTENEKKKIEYFRLYEIETDKELDEICDLTDYMTKMICKLK